MSIKKLFSKYILLGYICGSIKQCTFLLGIKLIQKLYALVYYSVTMNRNLYM